MFRRVLKPVLGGYHRCFIYRVMLRGKREFNARTSMVFLNRNLRRNYPGVNYHFHQMICTISRYNYIPFLNCEKISVVRRYIWKPSRRYIHRLDTDFQTNAAFVGGSLIVFSKPLRKTQMIRLRLLKDQKVIKRRRLNGD